MIDGTLEGKVIEKAEIDSAGVLIRCTDGTVLNFRVDTDTIGYATWDIYREHEWYADWNASVNVDGYRCSGCHHWSDLQLHKCPHCNAFMKII